MRRQVETQYPGVNEIYGAMGGGGVGTTKKGTAGADYYASRRDTYGGDIRLNGVNTRGRERQVKYVVGVR
jgi:hypothetical protein